MSFDVFTHNTARPNGHPVPKPESLILHLLDVFHGQTVCDPFMGSGTTMVAAHRLRRRGIGIEINETYCELAAKRLEQSSLPLEHDAAEDVALPLDGDAA